MTVVPRSRPADSRLPRAGEGKGSRASATLAPAPSPDRARRHDGSGSAGQDDRSVLVRHLAETPAFVGIGYAKAARLVEQFGDDLPRLLAEGDPVPFELIVGTATAANLVGAWRDDQATSDIVVWLDEQGLDSRLARRIIRLWGAEGASRLKDCPYALMAVMEWPTVDQVARHLGVAADDPARLVAAVEAVLYKRLLAQHTWMSVAEAQELVARLLGISEQEAGEAIDLAVSTGAAIPLSGGLQPAGAAMMERYVDFRIRTISEPPAIEDLIAREVGEEELDGWLDGAADQIGVILNAEQRNAVHLAIRGRFGLILGGAGVGKTTVLKAVCAACDAFGRAPVLMALAGRAAVRMTEAAGRPASTIAAFLMGVEQGKVSLGPETLVIVDEASMVDLPNLYRIVRSLPDGCRLLLVGDEAQLGPIGFGLTLHAFAEDGTIPRVRLRHVYRHAEETGIPVVAAAVRDGSLPHLPSRLFGGAGVALVETVEIPTADDVVDVVSRLGGFSGDLQILSPVKGRDAGTHSLNSVFHDIMAAGRPRLAGQGYAVGEPVIYGKNNYERDLRNGSLGTVVGIDAGFLSVDFDGVVHQFGPKDLEHVALAYAITTHKAQGSQFKTVVFPVLPSRILDRSLIYTALTRASERVVFIGQRGTLERAVRLPPSAGEREVGFGRLPGADSDRR